MFLHQTRKQDSQGLLGGENNPKTRKKSILASKVVIGMLLFLQQTLKLKIQNAPTFKNTRLAVTSQPLRVFRFRSVLCARTDARLNTYPIATVKQKTVGCAVLNFQEKILKDAFYLSDPLPVSEAPPYPCTVVTCTQVSCICKTPHLKQPHRIRLLCLFIIIKKQNS